MDIVEFKKMLTKVTETVFEHEEEFIKRFIGDMVLCHECTSLHYFYLSGSQCLAMTLHEYGDYTKKVIKTEDVLEWYEDKVTQ